MALKVLDACKGSVRGKTIAVLGLAFKADTDDMRDSPAIAMIQALQDFGASIRAYDPEAMNNAKKIFKNVHFADDSYDAATGADAIVVMTEWKEFASLNLDRLRDCAAGLILVDLRNMFTVEAAVRAGFDYWCIGKNNIHNAEFAKRVAAE